jgi:geranylgeranyl diphosphate synthase type II
VKEIFNVSGGSQATQDAIQDFTFKAFDTLDKMNLDTTKVLRAFGEKINGSTGVSVL